jgi:YD repeat-containing protein
VRGPLARFAASYDEAGHITSRTSVLGAPGSDFRNGTTTYAYDAAGNLSAAGVDGRVSTYALHSRHGSAGDKVPLWGGQACSTRRSCGSGSRSWSTW